MRNDSEAEDVLQEAYARAFAHLNGFRGDASLLTWLTSITLNEARDRLRQRHTMVELTQIEADQRRGADVINFPSTRSNPEEDLARAQMRQLLECAIDELPEPFRLVFIMRDVEECSIEETASSLAVRPETVKTRLFRARKLLRNALHEKLSDSSKDSFPFLGARCSRITEIVLERLASQFEWENAAPPPS